ncbi:MAG: hypothetical protein A3K50_09510, partial [Planctomycetes bacterium RIFOXYD12_FULL_42_12]
MVKKQNKLEVEIKGMHCASCEVLLERKFKKINGVSKVDVNYSRGSAILEYNKNKPDLNQIREIVKNAGYSLSSDGDVEDIPKLNRFIEITGILIIVLLIFYLLSILKVFDSIGVSDNMSLSFVFLIGIVAAFSSCLAVTGGLLVSITAKYSELHPNLKGFQKFKPHLYFNIGRILGYTILGGVIGAFGSIFAISTTVTGILTIVASSIMIILGLDLLGLSPKFLSFLKPSSHKKLSHKIMQKSDESPSKGTPFFLGASTFFLPCGFTIALQLYVLSKGDAMLGALTMLAFSLGTLPGLLSLGAFSSFLKGNPKRYFFTVVGIVVIILGIITIQNGFALAGLSNTQDSTKSTNNNNPIIDKNVRIENGVQIIDMTVKGYSYSPSQFTIIKGMPVEWRIDAKGATGCARVITIPKLGITKSLSTTEITTIKFTPDDIGKIGFSCTMGMTTRGAAFNVVEKSTDTITTAQTQTITSTDSTTTIGNTQTITSKISENKIAILKDGYQEIRMNVTYSGYSPNQFFLQKGVPVKWIINGLQVNGCSGAIKVPSYNLLFRVNSGEQIIEFTPKDSGVIPWSCSMGMIPGSFIVKDDLSQI